MFQNAFNMFVFEKKQLKFPWVKGKNFHVLKNFS